MFRPAIKTSDEKNRSYNFKHYLCDLIVFFIMTVTLTAALQFMLYDMVNIPQTVLFCFIFLGPIAIILYNWKVTIFFEALCVLFIGLITYQAYQEDLPQNALWNFLLWAKEYAYYIQGGQYPVYGLILCMILTFLTEFIMYIMVFKIRKVYLYGITGPLVFIFSYFLYNQNHLYTEGTRVGILTGLALYLTCLLFFIVQLSKARNVGKAGSVIPLCRYKAAVVPLLIAVFLLTVVLVPKQDKLYGSSKFKYGINNLFHIQSTSVDMPVFMPFDNGYDKDKKNHLGGNQKLSDAELFTVHNTRPVYLRGAIYTQYQSASWTTDTRYDTVKVRKEPVKPYENINGETLPVLMNPFSLNTNLAYAFLAEEKDNTFTRETCLITDNKMVTHTLFAPEYTNNITFLKGYKEIRANELGELTSNEFLGTKDEYYLTYLEPNLKSADLNRLLHYNYEVVSDPPYFNQYLQLPSDLPERVYDLANTLTRTSQYSGKNLLGVRYEACKSIQRFLHDHYTYTLSPKETPKGKDFIDYFLFDSQEGYCVYYASAMVMLARCAGFPARYVEGFHIGETSGEDGITVKENNAHAWAEVYFPQIGWLTFDAVSSNGSEPTVTPGPSASASPSAAVSPTPTVPPQTPAPSPTPSATLPVLTAPPVSVGPSATSATPPTPISVLPYVIIMGVLSVLLAIAFVLYKKNQYISLLKVRKDKLLPDDLPFLYKECVQMLGRYRLTQSTGETVKQYFERVESRFGEIERKTLRYKMPEYTVSLEKTLKKAAQAVTDYYYGKNKVYEKDLLALRDLNERLALPLKKQMTPIGFYIWWRK